MSNMKKSLRRKKNKKKKKEIQTKIALFDKLSDECLTCGEHFDKRNEEQVREWNVVVRNKEEKVNLYCPTCWSSAIDILDDFKKHLEDKNDS